MKGSCQGLLGMIERRNQIPLFASTSDLPF